MTSPILPLTAICKVRVFRGGYVYLNWMQCWAAGLVDFGSGAW